MHRPSDVGGFLQRFAVDLGRNFAAFTRLQFLHDLLYGILVEMGKVQFYIIQEFVTHHAHLKWCTHHSAEELRNIGGIVSHSKGHHGLCSGTVPAGRKCFLEEDNFDFMIIRNFGCFHMGDVETVQLHSSSFTKAVDNFSCFKRCTNLFFDLGKHILQIGVG